jgi:hypothetical protein
MTFHAGYRQMTASKYECRFLMARDIKRCGPVAVQCMTLFASVLVRRSRELCLVFVLVTIQAVIELDLVKSLLASGNMAPIARQLGVATLQWVRRVRMLFHSELGWFETIYAVATRALAAIRPLDELSLMLVAVAIHTLLKSQRLLEIAIAVALNAFHLLMFSEQRVLRLGVVEALA